MARTRRTYTPEFKAEAVKLVTEQGYSVAEAARSLGLSENLIRSHKQLSRMPNCLRSIIARAAVAVVAAAVVPAEAPDSEAKFLAVFPAR